MKMKKRGISPLIATVVLIFFVIIVLGIVFFWTKKVQEQTVAKNAELSRKQLECDAVEIEVESRDGRVVITNRGSIDISGFSLREEFGLGGDVRTSTTSENLIPGSSYTLIKGEVECLAGTSLIPGTLCSQTNTVLIEPGLRPIGRGAPLVPCENAGKKIRV